MSEDQEEDDQTEEKEEEENEEEDEENEDEDEEKGSGEEDEDEENNEEGEDEDQEEDEDEDSSENKKKKKKEKSQKSQELNQNNNNYISINNQQLQPTISSLCFEVDSICSRIESFISTFSSFSQHSFAPAYTQPYQLQQQQQYVHQPQNSYPFSSFQQPPPQQLPFQPQQQQYQQQQRDEKYNYYGQYRFEKQKEQDYYQNVRNSNYNQEPAKRSIYPPQQPQQLQQQQQFNDRGEIRFSQDKTLGLSSVRMPDYYQQSIRNYTENQQKGNFAQQQPQYNNYNKYSDNNGQQVRQTPEKDEEMAVSREYNLPLNKHQQDVDQYQQQGQKKERFKLNEESQKIIDNYYKNFYKKSPGYFPNPSQVPQSKKIYDPQEIRKMGRQQLEQKEDKFLRTSKRFQSSYQ